MRFINQSSKKAFAFATTFLFVFVNGVAYLGSFFYKTVKHNTINSTGWYSLSDALPSYEQTRSSNYWYKDNIDLENARKITTGRTNITVGIIDTGIESSHELLSSNYAPSGNVSFSPNSSSPNSNINYYHGTSVAGIISPSLDSNNDYIMGICSKVKMASIRADGPNSSHHYHETYTTIYDSLNYIQNNFDIVNYSGGFDNGGYYELSQTQRNALKYEIDNFDGLLIVAAGNYDSNNNIHYSNKDSNNNVDLANAPVYPACFDSSNLLVVGASDSNNNIVSGTMYGDEEVDLFAPGVDIDTTTTYSNGSYIDNFAGTSAAAPMVAGVAALMKSVNPYLSASDIKGLIMNNVDQIPALNGKCVTGGRLNAYKAVKSAIPLAYINNYNSSPNALGPGEDQWFYVYLEKNKIYNFTTVNTDSSGYLYFDIAAGYYTSNNIYGSGDFSISYECTASQPAYLRIRNMTNIVGPITFYPTVTHAHTPIYTAISALKHRMRCASCGSNRTEPHVFNGTTGRCIECNYYNPYNPYDSIGESPRSERVYFGDGSYLINDIAFLSDSDSIKYSSNELVIPYERSVSDAQKDV